MITEEEMEMFIAGIIEPYYYPDPAYQKREEDNE